MIGISAIQLVTATGEMTSLEAFSGKVCLVVNVASECGFTPQYESLQELYREYQSQGFEVLAFPCNQFGEQEPGSDDEILSFCKTNFDVTFPVFSKVDVLGANQHPLFALLTDRRPEKEWPADSGFRRYLEQRGAELEDPDVVWNFEKFLLSKDGEVIGRFAPDVEPDDPMLTDAIENALSQ